MDVKIGVVYTPKELIIELDGDPADIRATIDAALADATSLLWLADNKGRWVGVPTDKIAYIEIGGDDASKRVGFGR